MIADQPGRLVESNIVLNLNPPSAIADTSWIKPGKTPWDWWNAGKRPNRQEQRHREVLHRFLRAQQDSSTCCSTAAGRRSLPKRPGDIGYSFRGPMDLTKSIPAIDIPMLVEYAKSKGVRIWVWAHFRDVNDQMDAAFAQFEKWGIAGREDRLPGPLGPVDGELLP